MLETVEATAEIFTSHTADKNNPHNVTKEQVGLGNVDNTADMDKPVSNAVSSAINTFKEENRIEHAEIHSAINSLREEGEITFTEINNVIEALQANIQQAEQLIETLKQETNTALANKAASNHNHDSVYSKTSHTHTGYAASSHNHDSVYSKTNHTHAGYAASSHNHDSVYSKTNHTHTGYAASNHSHFDYAANTHNHDSTYATKSELNTGLAGKAASNHTHTLVNEAQTASSLTVSSSGTSYGTCLNSGLRVQYFSGRTYQMTFSSPNNDKTVLVTINGDAKTIGISALDN